MTADEVLAAEMFWVKRTQQQAVNSETFVEDKLQLNLQLNTDGVWVCCGRIQGEYPLYSPDSSLLTTKLVQRAHVCTLHGGVRLVMAKIREMYWIPRLRRLTEKVISDCWGCKKFRAVPAPPPPPPPGPLPKVRTEQSLIYSLIYSDNGSTFVAAAKWLQTVRKDEELNDLLRDYKISCRFNLSPSPWWGGQFERLIGLMKAAFYKTVGSGMLTWGELSEVLLDVEIAMNNRPLSNMEEDVQLPTRTPNSMLFLNQNYLPELKPHQEDTNMRK